MLCPYHGSNHTLASSKQSFKRITIDRLSNRPAVSRLRRTLHVSCGHARSNSSTSTSVRTAVAAPNTHQVTCEATSSMQDLLVQVVHHTANRLQQHHSQRQQHAGTEQQQEHLQQSPQKLSVLEDQLPARSTTVFVASAGAHVLQEQQCCEPQQRVKQQEHHLQHHRQQEQQQQLLQHTPLQQHMHQLHYQAQQGIAPLQQQQQQQEQQPALPGALTGRQSQDKQQQKQRQHHHQQQLPSMQEPLVQVPGSSVLLGPSQRQRASDTRGWKRHDLLQGYRYNSRDNVSRTPSGLALLRISSSSQPEQTAAWLFGWLQREQQVVLSAAGANLSVAALEVVSLVLARLEQQHSQCQLLVTADSRSSARPQGGGRCQVYSLRCQLVGELSPSSESISISSRMSSSSSSSLQEQGLAAQCINQQQQKLRRRLQHEQQPDMLSPDGISRQRMPCNGTSSSQVQQQQQQQQQMRLSHVAAQQEHVQVNGQLGSEWAVAGTADSAVVAAHVLQPTRMGSCCLQSGQQQQQQQNLLQLNGNGRHKQQGQRQGPVSAVELQQQLLANPCEHLQQQLQQQLEQTWQPAATRWQQQKQQQNLQHPQQRRQSIGAQLDCKHAAGLEAAGPTPEAQDTASGAVVAELLSVTDAGAPAPAEAVRELAVRGSCIDLADSLEANLLECAVVCLPVAYPKQAVKLLEAASLLNRRWQQQAMRRQQSRGSRSSKASNAGSSPSHLQLIMQPQAAVVQRQCGLRQGLHVFVYAVPFVH